jgi:hypothetical protein
MLDTGSITLFIYTKVSTVVILTEKLAVGIFKWLCHLLRVNELKLLSKPQNILINGGQHIWMVDQEDYNVAENFL